MARNLLDDIWQYNLLSTKETTNRPLTETSPMKVPFTVYYGVGAEGGGEGAMEKETHTIPDAGSLLSGKIYHSSWNLEMLTK